MQTKIKSHLEIIINQIVGIIIGWLIVYYIFPILDFLTKSQLATMSTIIFFVTSYSRAYIIRRIFNS